MLSDGDKQDEEDNDVERAVSGRRTIVSERREEDEDEDDEDEDEEDEDEDEDEEKDRVLV
jgi:hypothetical protein